MNDMNAGDRADPDPMQPSLKTAAPARLLGVGLLCGVVVGGLVVLFRLALDAAAALHDGLLAQAVAWKTAGLVAWIAAVAGTAATAAWLVRRFASSAAGSGIPRVMAVLDGGVAPAPARVVPVKFVAGTLAIGGCLVLGREGPSVQMGASAAYQLGRLFRLPAPDLLTLLAASPPRSTAPSRGPFLCWRCCGRASKAAWP